MAPNRHSTQRYASSRIAVSEVPEGRVTVPQTGHVEQLAQLQHSVAALEAKPQSACQQLVSPAIPGRGPDFQVESFGFARTRPLGFAAVVCT